MRTLIPALPLLFVLTVMSVTAYRIDRCPDCRLGSCVHSPSAPRRHTRNTDATIDDTTTRPGGRQ